MNECRSPHLSGATSYRYGCRCTRCTLAKIEQRNASAERRARGETLKAPPRPPAVFVDCTCELCGRTWRSYDSTVGSNPPMLFRRVCSRCRQPYSSTIRKHHLDDELALRLITTRRCEMCGLPVARSTNGRINVQVDHSHACCDWRQGSCGRCVRGFICQPCNIGVAYYERLRDVGLDKVERYLLGVAS